MKKLIGIEFYKMRHDLLIWGAFLIVVIASIGTALSDTYELNYIRYPRLEYYLVLQVMSHVFLILTIAITGYSIASDLQSGIVQNVLSAGVDRKSYYFSRLLVQILLTIAMFVIPALIFALTRFLIGIGRGRINQAFSFTGFVLLLFFMSLQVLAYCVLINMISYLCRSLMISVSIGFGWLVVELLGSALTESFHLEGMRKYTDLLPANVLSQCVDMLVDKPLALGELLRYGVIPVIFIVICGSVGYLWFKYSDNF